MQASRIAAARGADEAVYVGPTASSSRRRPPRSSGPPPTATCGRRRSTVGILDSITRDVVVAALAGRRGHVRPRRPARAPGRPSSPRPIARSSRSPRSTAWRCRPSAERAAGAAAEALAAAVDAERTARARLIVDLTLSDEQRLISETARRFADEVIAPRVRESDRALRFDADLARRLGEMGYLGAPVAERVRRPRPRLRLLRADRRADRPRRQRRADGRSRCRPRSSAARSSAGAARSRSSAGCPASAAASCSAASG